jgi:CheY-like chemotaxis protein
MTLKTDVGVPIEILLVEDNPGDVDLTLEGLSEARVRNHISVSMDGEDAWARLTRAEPYGDHPRPDLVLLDLNLPRLDGPGLLARIRATPALAHLPVVVLTSSAAERDIVRTYALHANCYVTKPIDLDQFMEVVRSIQHFWLTVVRLPT